MWNKVEKIKYRVKLILGMLEIIGIIYRGCLALKYFFRCDVPKCIRRCSIYMITYTGGEYLFNAMDIYTKNMYFSSSVDNSVIQ